MSTRLDAHRALPGTAKVALMLGAAVCTAAAEEPAWHALAVSGGAAALARAGGLDPKIEGWRVFYEAVRRRHPLYGEQASQRRASSIDEADGAAVGGANVPLPLAPAFWRRLLGRRAREADLAQAILADRRASLLYRGLAALDRETLTSLAAEDGIIEAIRRGPVDVFALFAGRFRIRAGVVDLPDPARDETAWRELVGESPRRAGPFLLALLSRVGGRRAFLFDSLAALDDAQRRALLGHPAMDATRRTERLRALFRAFEREPAWWRARGGAFARPAADVARILRDMRLTEAGDPAPPSGRLLWEAVLGETEPGPQRGIWAERLRASPPAEAVWLAERLANGETDERAARLESLVFAQRVFCGARPEELEDVVEAVRGLGEARTLLLALERIGIRAPSLYAAAVRVARRLDVPRSGPRAARAHGQLQGALTLVERARWAGTLDVPAAEDLVRSLLAVSSAKEEGPDARIPAWLDSSLLPVLARAVYRGAPPGDADAIVLRALAGAILDEPAAAPIEWEGLAYRVDIGGTEWRRLERVRARQGGTSLEAARGFCRAALRLRAEPGGAGRLEACEALTSEVLTSLAYAPHLGDPAGPALRADVARRHDFATSPFSLPEEVAGPGVPWHVRGSLLGLDLALAPLRLHRLEGDALPEHPPLLDRQYRRALAPAAAFMNPRTLTDADRDEIAAAVRRGQGRVRRLRTERGDASEVAREAGLPPWRAQALLFVLESEPAALDRFFSLAELFRLGRPGPGDWDAWGAPDPLVRGLRLHMPAAQPFESAAGRPPPEAIAALLPDGGLRVAVHLAERRLPAALAPALVETLVPHLLADSEPTGPDDGLGLAFFVRDVPAEWLDDALASLVGQGPLQPAASPGGGR